MQCCLVVITSGSGREDKIEPLEEYHIYSRRILEDLQRVAEGLKKFFSFKLSTVSLMLCSRGVNSRPRLFAFSLETWYTGRNGWSSTHLKITDKKFKIKRKKAQYGMEVLPSKHNIEENRLPEALRCRLITFLEASMQDKVRATFWLSLNSVWPFPPYSIVHYLLGFQKQEYVHLQHLAHQPSQMLNLDMSLRLHWK